VSVVFARCRECRRRRYADRSLYWCHCAHHCSTLFALRQTVSTQYSCKSSGKNRIEQVGHATLFSLFLFPIHFPSCFNPRKSTCVRLFRSLILLSLSLKVGLLNSLQLGNLGGRCKLPRHGQGQSPSGNQIWWISVLKSGILWRQF